MSTLIIIKVTFCLSEKDQNEAELANIVLYIFVWLQLWKRKFNFDEVFSFHQTRAQLESNEAYNNIEYNTTTLKLCVFIQHD